MEESHTSRVAAVLAADADLEAGVGVPTALGAELDELTEQASVGDGLTFKAGGQTQLYITVELGP